MTIFKNNRVSLVLGGTGFIGSNLVRSLLDRGDRVMILSRNPSQASIQHKNIQYISGDIEEPLSYVRYLPQADQIFYLISTTNPKSANENPVFDISSNLISFVDFLEQNVASTSLPVIFLSSGGTVYGQPNYWPIDELHPTEPICSYGIVKLAIEKYLHAYALKYEFDYKILRVSNPYGAKFHKKADQGIINVFFDQIQNDSILNVWGDGSVIRDYIYIDDLCAAILKVSDYAGIHHCFNIGSGVGYSILDIISKIGACLDKKPQVKFKPKRNFDAATNVLDISLAKKELTWEPKVSFKDGVELMLQDVYVA
jgi:UDP-glucose 4-epimerase